MRRINHIQLTVALVWVHIPQSECEEQVEISTPDNSVFHRKIGSLYQSVNVGHIRLQINLTKVRGITTTICSHSDNLSPYLTYTNFSLLTKMNSSKYWKVNQSTCEEIEEKDRSLPPSLQDSPSYCRDTTPMSSNGSPAK